ncbi:MAG: CNNM domain-containing protein [Planctomycetota bacterium]
MTWGILAIAVYLALSGLFSGSEIGLYSVNRLRLRSRVEGGQPQARILRDLIDRSESTITAILVCNNITIYAVTAIATELLGARTHPELMATLLMTPVIFLFGEMAPKEIFRSNADVIMYRLAGPLDALRVLLLPVTAGLQGLARLVTGGLHGRRRRQRLSRAWLRQCIAEGRREGVLSAYQHRLTANVMRLPGTSAGQAMTPLRHVEMIEADAAGADLGETLRRARHSRLPVYQGSPERVRGVLHAMDYATADGRRPAQELARAPVTVGTDDAVTAALVTLQRGHQQMAVVTDPLGRAAGVVTVKDLVEEIVGELDAF